MDANLAAAHTSKARNKRLDKNVRKFSRAVARAAQRGHKDTTIFLWNANTQDALALEEWAKAQGYKAFADFDTFWAAHTLVVSW